MLPKIVGYQGFQSYGDLKYSDLKTGKESLDTNTLFEKSRREVDQPSLYENYNYKASNYHVEQLGNLKPEDYKEVSVLRN